MSEKLENKLNNIFQVKQLLPYKKEILSKKSMVIEYEENYERYILNTKYIPELELFLSVQANLKDFTSSVKKIFYFNIIFSLIITLLIAGIVYLIIKKYSSKL